MLGSRSILHAIALLALLAVTFICLTKFNSKPSSSRTSEVDEHSNFDTISEINSADLSSMLFSFAKREISRAGGWGDLYAYTNKLRFYKELRKFSVEINLTPDQYSLISLLHDHLFKWALKGHTTIDELKKSFSGKGIVICTGEKYFKLVVHSIKVLRVIGCELPVEIFYNGPEDLSESSIRYLNGLRNVKCVDLMNYFDCKVHDIKGWDMKPFSMLASSFSETILMDADTVFVQSPEEMFHDPGYIQSGTMFFYDRSLFGYLWPNATEFMHSFLPDPLSDHAKSSRFYNRMTNYEQEAGVVLINKSRGLLGLMAACAMNLRPFKDVLHAKTHGDKESYWLGFEMAGEPFYFVPVLCGSIGKKIVKNNHECIEGKAAHFDRNRKLLWFNDGIVNDKHFLDSEPFDYEYIGIEGWWDNLCVRDQEARKIDGETRKNLQKIVSTFERNPMDMSDPRAGAAMYNLGLFD